MGSQKTYQGLKNSKKLAKGGPEIVQFVLFPLLVVLFANQVLAGDAFESLMLYQFTVTVPPPDLAKVA
jgi:hypothetical protein